MNNSIIPSAREKVRDWRVQAQSNAVMQTGVVTTHCSPETSKSHLTANTYSRKALTVSRDWQLLKFNSQTHRRRSHAHQKFILTYSTPHQIISIPEVRISTHGDIWPTAARRSYTLAVCSHFHSKQRQT